MKRTLDTNEPIKWQKRGGGSVRMNINGKNKIIKPNQVFMACIDEIPQGFRDVIIPVDRSITQKDITEAGETAIEVRKSEIKIIPRSPGWFNVVNEQGKRLNENALREDEAGKLKSQLEE